MIYTFRLSRLSGNNHTFTLGKDISFTSLSILAVTLDDPIAAGSSLIGSASDVPLYLFCNLLDNDDVIFNNGKATALTAGGTRLIPLATISTGTYEAYSGINGIRIINRPTDWTASQTITWAIKEIAGDGSTMTNAAAVTCFGDDVLDSDGSSAIDTGINIVCEFTLRNDSHHYDGDKTIANSI